MSFIGNIDGRLLTLLAFIVINFLILFVVKTRTTTVISLIIAHLIAVLFFSLSISNYDSFKEIVLGLIIYSMVTLFLVSNYNPIHLDGEEDDNKNLRMKIMTVCMACIIVFIVFILTFWIAKNIASVNASVIAKKAAIRQAETKLNVPKNLAATTLLLSQKPQSKWIKERLESPEISHRKKERLRRSLADNFLLKRSSDVILIIVALSVVLMLLRKNNLTKS